MTLIPINDKYPSVVLTDGEGRRSMVRTGACWSMHTLPTMHCCFGVSYIHSHNYS
jgi:hypothetical protein